MSSFVEIKNNRLSLSDASAVALYGFKIYIDSDISTEFLTIKSGKNEYKIKIAGNLDEIYYCGKDVAMLLGYSTNISIQEALTNLNKKYKKRLGNIVQQQDIIGKHINELSMQELTENGFMTLAMQSESEYSDFIKNIVVKAVIQYWMHNNDFM